MAAIDLNTTYPNKDAYWRLVDLTLEQVFNGNPADARAFRLRLDSAPPEEQTIFYHAEPLDVAADIADVVQATPQQVANYNNLARREGWY